MAAMHKHRKQKEGVLNMKASKKHMRFLAAALCAVMLAACVPAVADSYATVRGGLLNLRAQASTGAKSLALFPTGTWVTVHEDKDGWSRVTVNGISGYMMSKYLTAGASGATLYVRTNTGIGLNLRATPSMSGEILTSFRPNTAVRVLQKGNGWYKVSVDGQEGYMSSRFLAGASQSYTKPVTAFAATLKNINGGSVVNFRLYPGMKTKILGVYPVGTQVTVLEMGENWSLVDINGAKGYVSTYFLKY